MGNGINRFYLIQWWMGSTRQSVIVLMGLMVSLSIVTVVLVNFSEPSQVESVEERGSNVSVEADQAVNLSDQDVVDVDEVREDDRDSSEMNILEQAIYGLLTLSEDIVAGWRSLT